MKIGIVTINDFTNYGNRLQNYATYKLLNDLCGNADNIPIYSNNNLNKSGIKQEIKKIVICLYSIIKNLDIKKMSYITRYEKFRKFTEVYIKQSDYIILDKKVPKNINNKYDYFVCGSDQIWNPEFDFNSEINFLNFADKGKKIAYAPSFGISELPHSCIKDYKKWISGIDYLSVREDAGAGIIEKLIGEKPIVLLDPTLMLNKNEWLAIAKKPTLDSSRKYILTYFLGKQEEKTRKKIENIAKKNNLLIINLLDINEKYSYCVDPSEFIWLINNCELMCTDSFHGVVFSLIMKSPFIVFERKDSNKPMNSRLDTLLSKFNMKHRVEDNIDGDEKVFEVDFSKVDDIVDCEKNKTLNYLRNAFKLNCYN